MVARVCHVKRTVRWCLLCDSYTTRCFFFFRFFSSVTSQSLRKSEVIYIYILHAYPFCSSSYLNYSIRFEKIFFFFVIIFFNISSLRLSYPFRLVASIRIDQWIRH